MKNLFILVLLVTSGICFAQKTISSDGQKLIDNFFDLRMSLSVYDRETQIDEIINVIDNFTTQNNTFIESADVQEQLIISNLIVMEKYNYLFSNKKNKDKLHDMMGIQKKLCEDYYLTHNEEETNKWLLCTRADVISCYMGLNIADIMKNGLSIKPLYVKAIEQDSDFSYGLTNIGQWYYYAPAITGGSKKTALNYFYKAVQAAKSSSEKYFADIYLSQLLYENKKIEESKNALNDALIQCPESKYVRFLQTLNQNGKSLYDYNKSLSGADKN